MTFLSPAIRPLALLALANGASEAALLPLVPAIKDDLGLTGAQVGGLFAATTLAVLMTAVPAGQLAARYGTRPVMLASALLGPAALVVMALAPGLPALLAARLVFGVAFSIVWSVAPGVAAARVPGARGSGTVIAASGVGWLAGPLVAGVVGDAWGWRPALLIVGIATLSAALPFLRQDGHERVSRPVRLRETVSVLLRSNRAVWAAVVSALLGVVTGAMGVLVPTVLSDNGVSAAGIGLAIGLSAGVWALVGAWSGQLGGGRIDVRLVGGAAAALASCWALPVASLSSGTVVGFLLLAAACRALLGTLVYPLAARATDGEAAAAALSGVLTFAWAVPALVAPVLVGVAADQGAARAVFAIIGVLAATVAAAMLASGHRVATA